MGKPIHEILQEIMDEKKISIAETARICDLPDSTVRGIITRHQKSIALEVAFKLSNGLNVSLRRLNGETEKAPEPEEPASEALIKERVRLLTDFFVKMGYIEPGGDISDDDLRKFMALADFLDAFFSK